MSKFTPKQLEVINHNQGNIVVSASAGSGKTSVMVERLTRIITSGEVSVKEILAVTFTRLAAAEMRDRLFLAITDRIKKGGDPIILRQQLMDLPSASISTIDSFLTNLIRKYFYLTDVDSSFSIVADAEQISLKSTAVNEVFERLYDEDNEHILRLIKIYSRKRKDDALKKLILSVYEFLVSETDGDTFLNKALFNYTEEGLKDIDNRLIDRFLSIFAILKQRLYDLFYRAKNLNIDSYMRQINQYLGYIEELLKNRSIESFKVFAEFKPKRASLSVKDDDFKAQLYDDYTEAISIIKWLRENIIMFFSEDFETRAKSLEEPKAVLESLIYVTRLFSEEYTRLKREQNLLDYGDISHIGYKLLQQDEVREDIRSTYKYIFVDEYQDTNGIQESVFKLLENNNLFVVGDVKQSIYGFRGCRSDNFADRIEKAKSSGKFVELDSNFRSAPAVIDAVNGIFSSSMTQKTTAYDYKNHPMKSGGLFKDYKGEVKYLYSAKVEDNTKLNLGVYSVQKHLSAAKVQKPSFEKLVVYAVKMALTKEVFDVKTGKTRPATYRDIAILNRTVESGVDRVVKELEDAGIPTVSENKRSIKSYPEIVLMVNILQCVMAGTQDIPFAAALKSPLGGLSDGELKTIRDSESAVSFYEAAVKYSKQTDGIAQKLQDYFKYIHRLRMYACFEGAPTLIRRIMREKFFNIKYLSEDGGEAKLARLEVFISHGYRGAREMFIEEFMSDIDSALGSMTAPSQGDADAVNVMSMHASKGLEFPIVIVAGVDRDFNRTDKSDEVMLVRNGGIGLKNYLPATKQSTNNVIRQYVSLLKQEENMRDEMRLLYVALTRAKCCLYIVSKKEPKKNRTEDLFKASCQRDFFSSDIILCEEVSLEAIKTTPLNIGGREVILNEPNDESVKKIKAYTDFQYPYLSDVTLSLKQTVTDAVKDSAYDIEDFEATRSLFGSGDKDTGNAYHKILQLIDFEKADNGLIDQLLQQSFSEEEKLLIDKDRVLKILGLNVFTAIKGFKCYKEQPFIVSVPPKILGIEGSEDLLLQGVIDLLCIKGDEAIVIDYKYSGKSKEALVKTYKKQLDLYAYAVEKTLGKRVIKKVLVNLLSLEESPV